MAHECGPSSFRIWCDNLPAQPASLKLAKVVNNEARAVTKLAMPIELAHLHHRPNLHELDAQVPRINHIY
jgi:hypothetical protein